MDAVEEKVLTQGYLTGQPFLELLKEEQSTMKDYMVSWLDKLKDLIVYMNPNANDEENDCNSNNDAAHDFVNSDE